MTTLTNGDITDMSVELWYHADVSVENARWHHDDVSVDDAYVDDVSVDDVSVDSVSSSQDGSMMMVANVASKIVALSGLG
jgi:hypothetical protein